MLLPHVYFGPSEPIELRFQSSNDPLYRYHRVNVFKNDKMTTAISILADKINIPAEQIYIKFDGEVVNEFSTLDELGLENHDVLDYYINEIVNDLNELNDLNDLDDAGGPSGIDDIDGIGSIEEGEEGEEVI